MFHITGMVSGVHSSVYGGGTMIVIPRCDRDLAVTAAMQMAKALKKNPRDVAAALVQALQAQPAVQRLSLIHI